MAAQPVPESDSYLRLQHGQCYTGHRIRVGNSYQQTVASRQLAPQWALALPLVPERVRAEQQAFPPPVTAPKLRAAKHPHELVRQESVRQNPQPAQRPLLGA